MPRFLALLAFGMISTPFWGQMALGGLYTPVNLDPDTSTVYLRDYLANSSADSVQAPAGLKIESLNGDTLRLYGKMKEKMGLLRIFKAGREENLVLIRSSRQSVDFRFKRKDLPAKAKEVRLIGSFNNWDRSSAPLTRANGYYETRLLLKPGRYFYKLYVDGVEVMDPNNPEQVPNGMGSFNNVLVVPGSGEEAPDFLIEEAGEGFLQLRFLRRSGRFLALWNNQALTIPCRKSEPMSCSIRLPAKASKIERSFLRIYTFQGQEKGRDQLIPLHYGKPLVESAQLKRLDWHAARLYFLMIDRFYDGTDSNNRPLDDPQVRPQANYQGGDLQGVQQKLEAGYFQRVGINTLWLSPVTQNPWDAWGYWDKGPVKSKFSGYHGYWPISNTRVDARFGDSAMLKLLIDSAHQKNFNVILDYVANHVHLQHPVYQKNRHWATSLYLPDGSKNTEKWDEHRLTTWFDDHLPTLDLRRYEVVDPMVDSALAWITDYGFDGFRHDATKHIDELYWRTLTYRLRQNTTRPLYQIGETYGSPELINAYLSTGMLDAQFDFNLYDAAVQAFARSENLEALKNALEAGLKTYGYHHLMGNISGNQDRSRFISLAGGEVKFDEDQKLAGWERKIGKPQPQAYRRLALLHAFNYAIPGVPCIYYGDEIGMPGANDPDNRRMMRFANWDKQEQTIFDAVAELNSLRAQYLPLIFGSTQVYLPNEHLMLIRRSYLGKEVVVALNLSEKAQTFHWPMEIEGLKRIDQRGGDFMLPPQETANGILIPGLSYRYFANY